MMRDRNMRKLMFKGRIGRRAVVAGLGAFASVAAAWFVLLVVVPPPEPYRVKPAGRQVFARDGRLLMRFLSPDDKWRVRVPLEEVSPHLVAAVLEHEDRWFRYHPGVNPISVVRSAWTNLRERRIVTGASTLTMQLARIVEPGQRSFSFKLFQAFRALQYEWLYSKDEILEMYLNLAPYGGNLEGVGAASWAYFDKPPSELSTAEAALLAVLPESPTARNPEDHPGEARAARDRLIDRLEKKAMIDGATAFESRMQPVPEERFPAPFDAPHFAQWVTRKYRGDLNLRTTLDYSIQTRAEDLLEAAVLDLRPSGIEQGALVILDYERSELVAMVGSAGFGDPVRSGQVNGALARRSPGSTLKPFVYALAFDWGLATPSTLLEDVPLHFGSYSPENFDGTYRGMIRASEALEESRNVPAVLLARELDRNGREGLYGLLKRAGVSSLDRPRSHYGLSLVLGGAEVTLLELVELYAVLARQGVRVETKTVISGGDGLDRERSGRDPDSTRILSREAAFLTLDILTNVPRPELEAVWRSGTHRIPIPWKTGTSYGHRDAWSVGIAGRYVVGIWLGNFDGSGVPHLVGRRVAAPLLFDLIDLLPEESGDWHVLPPGIGFREVCALSGATATEHCPETRVGMYIPGISPSRPCHIHREIMIDTETGRTVCSRCRTRGQCETRVVEWWPPRIASYLATGGMLGLEIPPHNPACPVFGTRESPEIVSPQEGTEYHIRPGAPLEDQKIALIATVSRGCHRVYWFLDGELIWKGTPDETVFLLPVPGRHRITVTDDAGRSAVVTMTILG